MLRYMIQYIKTKIRPEPIIVYRDVIKEQIVQVPLLPEHIKHLEQLFPQPEWKVGVSTPETMAYSTGQHSVVQYLKKWSSRGSKGGV